MRTNIFVLFFFYKNYIFFKIQDPFSLQLHPVNNRALGNILPYNAALSPLSQEHIPLILHLDLGPILNPQYLMFPSMLD